MYGFTMVGRFKWTPRVSDTGCVGEQGVPRVAPYLCIRGQ